MTFPRVERDLLMAAPSCNLAPVAPVESALSLHAEDNVKAVAMIHLLNYLAVASYTWICLDKCKLFELSCTKIEFQKPEKRNYARSCKCCK